MARIGEFNQLPISRESTVGLYLDAGELGEVLLPGSLVPIGVMPYHKLNVFLYFDTGNRLTATTKMPYVSVGKFAYLEVVDVHPKMGHFWIGVYRKTSCFPMGRWMKKCTPGKGW